jgi:hypothetical protein
MSITPVKPSGTVIIGELVPSGQKLPSNDESTHRALPQLTTVPSNFRAMAIMPFAKILDTPVKPSGT